MSFFDDFAKPMCKAMDVVHRAIVHADEVERGECTDCGCPCSECDNPECACDTHYRDEWTDLPEESYPTFEDTGIEQ